MLQNKEDAISMAKNGFDHVRTIMNVKYNAKYVLDLYSRVTNKI